MGFAPLNGKGLILLSESFTIVKARPENKKEILTLYRSLIGVAGCTWTLEYPNEQDVESDIESGSLYCMRCDKGLIIGAASLGVFGDLDCIDCWKLKMSHPCELARVGIMAGFMNRGLAERLLRYVEKDALQRGFDGIRLLVCVQNPPAQALYDKLDFIRCGERHIYGHDYYCCEKFI